MHTHRKESDGGKFEIQMTDEDEADFAGLEMSQGCSVFHFVHTKLFYGIKISDKFVLLEINLNWPN